MRQQGGEEPIQQETVVVRPTEEELRVARLLARGLKDEVVVKRLALAHRTYRRRVHDLMDKLGARSRFEAGVLAERARWTKDPSSPAARREAGPGARVL